MDRWMGKGSRMGGNPCVLRDIVGRWPTSDQRERQRGETDEEGVITEVGRKPTDGNQTRQSLPMVFSYRLSDQISIHNGVGQNTDERRKNCCVETKMMMVMKAVTALRQSQKLMDCGTQCPSIINRPRAKRQP